MQQDEISFQKKCHNSVTKIKGNFWTERRENVFFIWGMEESKRNDFSNKVCMLPKKAILQAY